jgi:hypothetical protein
MYIFNLQINFSIPAYVDQPNKNPNFIKITIYLVYGLKNNDLRVFFKNTNI